VLGGLVEFVTEVVERLGYVGLLLMVALENVFPPIPSEVILPLAGFNVFEGDFSFPLVMLFATLGSVIGALALYAIGAWFGEARLRAIVRVHGGKLFLKEADIDNAEAWFRRYGPLAVFLCRMVPIVRSLISIPAGLDRMALGRFVLLSAAGSFLWNAALVGAGWALGTQWDRVEGVISAFQFLVIAAGALFVAWFLWTRISARLRRSRG
jgi:membrane protein DedA with SNARE-associated domain